MQLLRKARSLAALGQERPIWGVPAMSASPPIVLQKSFCTGGRKFCGPLMRFSCKDVGASSPHVNLARDLANVSDPIRIGDCFPFRNFAKNQSPCNFRLLQQYPPKASKSPRRTEWRKGAKKVPAASAVDALGIVKKP